MEVSGKISKAKAIDMP